MNIVMPHASPQPGPRWMNRLPRWLARFRTSAPVVCVGFCLLLAVQISLAAGPPVPEIVVTNDLVLDPNAVLSARLVIRASHVTIDGRGATLAGPGLTNELKSMESAGIGVVVEGVSGVILKNLRVRGFATGLLIRQAQAIDVSECDFSDNYHNPKHGWGELPARGGIRLEQARHCVIRRNHANRVWDAVSLIDSDDNLVAENDFSFCSNTCAKLWKSSRNKFLENNLSYGIRIDRAAGEVHARDSTCVLIETGSDDNFWYRNDITHGGDGVFIRPLNRWVSRGNIFIENDTSYGNNNCVESWSPGNVFIRNKANYGSYGFWLGGSDQTILLDNEAAFNGRPDGYHNAPEGGFGHGGIVIVGGPSSHSLLAGNHLHDNHGAGLAFRGDTATKGRAWRTEHWVVQQNRIASNRFGIWGRFGDGILLAANVVTNNTEGNFLEDVAHLVELPGNSAITVPPVAVLDGPEVVDLGVPVRFDASRSHDPMGRPLGYHWWLDGLSLTEPQVEHRFDRQGFYRLSLTVDNGGLADLAWRNVLVVAPVAEELGTEGQAARWGFELELNGDGKGRMQFADDAHGIVGRRCLRFTPNPYPGAYATAIFPAARDARWNFTGKRQIRFWVRGQNPNVPGYQNAGPVVRLLGPAGDLEYRPVKDGNIMNDPPDSEARWLWMPVTIPLNGDARWQRIVHGTVSLERIDALSLSLDSWGGDPFTIWLDGLTVD
jgi:parallel beta-helix repeat protein